MRINEISIANDPDAWRLAGFTVDHNRVVIGSSFVIRLTGSSDADITAWTLGVDGRAGSSTSRSGGLSLAVEAPNKPDAVTIHENGVTHCLKAVLLSDNTATSLQRLQSEIPELGKPPNEGREGGVHWALWPLEDFEWGLEVACLDPNQSADEFRIALVVDDLDAAIDRIGESNLSEVSLYAERRTVSFKPESGVTPGITLIAKS